jgi:hypothetical protein
MVYCSGMAEIIGFERKPRELPANLPRELWTLFERLQKLENKPVVIAYRGTAEIRTFKTKITNYRVMAGEHDVELTVQFPDVPEISYVRLSSLSNIFEAPANDNRQSWTAFLVELVSRATMR